MRRVAEWQGGGVAHPVAGGQRVGRVSDKMQLKKLCQSEAYCSNISYKSASAVASKHPFYELFLSCFLSLTQPTRPNRIGATGWATHRVNSQQPTASRPVRSPHG